jgi:hypothetical protein
MVKKIEFIITLYLRQMLLRKLPRDIRNRLMICIRSRQPNTTDEKMLDMETLETREILEPVMLCLNAQDILDIGEEDVPKRVWSLKLDKDLLEAYKNGSIIGVRHHAKNGVDIQSSDKDILLLNSVINDNLDIFKYLLMNDANIKAGGGLILDIINKKKKFDFAMCLFECSEAKYELLRNRKTLTDL